MSYYLKVSPLQIPLPRIKSADEVLFLPSGRTPVISILPFPHFTVIIPPETDTTVPGIIFMFSDIPDGSLASVNLIRFSPRNEYQSGVGESARIVLNTSVLLFLKSTMQSDFSIFAAYVMPSLDCFCLIFLHSPRSIL